MKYNPFNTHDAEYSVVEGAETTTIETHEERHTHSTTHRAGLFGPEVVTVCEKTVIKRVETITPLVTATFRPKADTDITINMDFGCAKPSEAPQQPLQIGAQRLL